MGVCVCVCVCVCVYECACVYECVCVCVCIIYVCMSGEKQQRLQAAACPASLLPHPDVVQLLEELREVMASFETSLIPARLRENYFRRVDKDAYVYIYVCILICTSQ